MCSLVLSCLSCLHLRKYAKTMYFIYALLSLLTHTHTHTHRLTSFSVVLTTISVQLFPLTFLIESIITSTMLGQAVMHMYVYVYMPFAIGGKERNPRII